MSPLDQTVLKDKIKQSHILSEKEKQEWLFLLPKMSEEQIAELEQILALHITLPSKGAPNKFQKQSPPSPLPARLASESVAGRPVLPHKGEENEKENSSPLMGEDKVGVMSSNDNLLDYLRSLSIETLRADGTVHSFFLDLKKKIQSLRLSHSAQEIKTAFEQSPLWKTYLGAGMAAMESGTQNLMSQAEFEMVNDFRAELRKLLN